MLENTVEVGTINKNNSLNKMFQCILKYCVIIRIIYYCTTRRFIADRTHAFKCRKSKYTLFKTRVARDIIFRFTRRKIMKS